MRNAIAMLTLGVMVGLLAGGCGGGGGGSKPLSKTDYVKQMTAIGKSLSTSISTLSSVTTAAKAATALAKVQTDLRDAVKQLDAITPPDDVKTAHEQLSTAVREFADELGPVVTKLKKGNLAALSSVTTLKGLTDIQTAANAITKAGYKISG
jgi:hypothetical protein